MRNLTALSPLVRLLLITSLLTAALLAVVCKHYYALSRATPIILETVPVDPRSLFQGDYVILTYSINQVDTKLFGDNHPMYKLGAGDAFYLILTQQGNIWQAHSASLTRPPPQAGQIAILGKATETVTSDTRAVSARYGIESFFVPEGEGRWIERLPPDQQYRLRVEVKVTPQGQVYATQLLLDGQPLFAAPRP
jgi:uncharacterized membrane-anchored protein